MLEQTSVQTYSNGTVQRRTKTQQRWCLDSGGLAARGLSSRRVVETEQRIISSMVHPVLKLCDLVDARRLARSDDIGGYVMLPVGICLRLETGTAARHGDVGEKRRNRDDDFRGGIGGDGFYRTCWFRRRMSEIYATQRLVLRAFQGVDMARTRVARL